MIKDVTFQDWAVVHTNGLVLFSLNVVHSSVSEFCVCFARLTSKFSLWGAFEMV